MVWCRPRRLKQTAGVGMAAPTVGRRAKRRKIWSDAARPSPALCPSARRVVEQRTCCAMCINGPSALAVQRRLTPRYCSVCALRLPLHSLKLGRHMCDIICPRILLLYFTQCYVRPAATFDENAELQWPGICPLCQKPVLQATDCVRRPCCLDVLHKSCNEAYEAYATSSGQSASSTN
jgi:hypothetical protein